MKIDAHIITDPDDTGRWIALVDSPDGEPLPYAFSSAGDAVKAVAKWADDRGLTLASFTVALQLGLRAPAPSPATEPEPPMWSGSSPIDAMTPGWGQESDPCYLGGWRCSVCPVCPYNPAFTEAERNAAIAARTPPPPAAPAVSPEPERDEP